MQDSLHNPSQHTVKPVMMELAQPSPTFVLKLEPVSIDRLNPKSETCTPHSIHTITRVKLAAEAPIARLPAVA